VTELIAAQELAGPDGDVSGTYTITYTSSSTEEGSEETADVEEEVEEEESAVVGISTSMSTSTQTVSENTILTGQFVNDIPWSTFKTLAAPSEIFETTTLQDLDDESKATIIKLYEAHRV